jgi:hypothetical protein
MNEVTAGVVNDPEVPVRPLDTVHPVAPILLQVMVVEVLYGTLVAPAVNVTVGAVGNCAAYERDTANTPVIIKEYIKGRKYLITVISSY